ncbi:hypothetical protein ACVZGI_20815 [Klebsiella pneumoniae]
MAEVPLPTPTQVPVPSTDIRNAVFAGAKLDEEVTGTGEFYTDRLGVKRLTNTGRNNQFDAAQLDRAKEGANKQVISSQADSLIKISRIWADFFPANTSNQPI